MVTTFLVVLFAFYTRFALCFSYLRETHILLFCLDMYLCAGVLIVTRTCLLHAHVAWYHLVDYIDRAFSYHCFVDGSLLEVFWSILSSQCSSDYYPFGIFYTFLPHYFNAFLESMRSRILLLSLPWEVGIDTHDGASVVGACSGIPPVYLKTRLGRFCVLMVYGLFKVLFRA